MKRILLTAMVCVIISTVVDAAPRGRRAARRRAAQLQQQRTVQPQQRTKQSQYYRASNGRYYYYPRTTSTASRTYTQPQVARTQATTPVRVASSTATTQNAVTAYKPVLPATTSTPEPSPTTVAMANVSPIETSVAAEATQVIQAAAIEPIPDVMPKLKSESTTQPFCASCQVIPAGRSFGSALAELNGIRASRGLPALIEDASLTALAHQKASIQANANAMYHPGGSMGGARFEGVGMGPRFTTCYQDATNVRYAGAATVTAANGQRYHCLLVR